MGSLIDETKLQVDKSLKEAQLKKILIFFENE